MLLREPGPASSASTHTRSPHTRSPHARNADAGPAKAPAMPIGLVILEQNGIDHGIGTLSRLDRLIQTFFTACIDAVGEHDQSFAALLLLHQIVRSQIDGIIERRAAPAPMVSGAPPGAPPGTRPGV